MLSDEVLEKVTERITSRLEELNTFILKQIGETIKKTGTLTPSKARQLEQILKYGGDYDKIVKKIAKVTELNVKDIKEIFKEVAKNDYQFAKKFYKYRGKKFIPYESNAELKRQVTAITNQMIDEYITKTKALGINMTKLDGTVVFTPLKQAYRETIDRAVLSVAQGKNTFQTEMYNTIKEIASGGLRSFVYESGRTMRLDSAIRMNMRDKLRQLHNEEQKLFGEEFDADGVEVSVHFNPAPDHAEMQGHQFSNKQFKKLQEDGIAKDYKGKEIDLHLELKSGETAKGFRPVSMYNCYHYTFSIVLGISEPEYTDKELQQIIDDNNKGFVLDGKHYTNYEGTQLQRKLETAIRKQKDIQIMAREGGVDELVRESQDNITALTRKYKELSRVSGLPTKMDRMRVPGYRRIKINNDIFKNSLVKDENGQLLKMYHGSTTNFDNFDTSKIREVDYDAPFNGFWFSSDKETSPAMTNAKYTKEVELNVQNPAPYKVWNKLSKEVEQEFYDNNGEISGIFDKRSRSTNDEVRYRLQKMGYDGIHWSGKPDIDINELEQKGETIFEHVSGRTRYKFVKTAEGYDLQYLDGESITGFDSVEEYLNMQDEEWVVFDPKQIKILKKNIK